MMPAAASTWRCLVTPWRVMSCCSASTEIDDGPSSDSGRTSMRRVGSPSAANISAALVRFRLVGFGILLDPDDDLGPAAAVVGEDLRPAGERDFVEAGLGHAQTRAASRRLEREGDRRSRLVR